MTAAYWRRISNTIVLNTLKATDGMPESEIKKALVNAYPFGERKMYPYKIWLDSVKRVRRTFNLLKQARQLSLQETRE
jgi:hypothetical protein